MTITRLSTGITGLDQLLVGGIPQSRNILLSGPCGCGKTSVAAQFLVAGAKRGEKCLYVTFEQPKKTIVSDLRTIGVRLEPYEKNKTLLFIGGSVAKVTSTMKRFDAEVEHIIEEIFEVVKKEKIQRVVIDSVNLFTLLMTELVEKRVALAKLLSSLSDVGCTSMCICEVPEGKNMLSWNGVEEFIADGVIAIYKFSEGSKFSFGISVRKMRGSDHDKTTRVMKITKKGVRVYADQSVIAGVL